MSTWGENLPDRCNGFFKDPSSGYNVKYSRHIKTVDSLPTLLSIEVQPVEREFLTKWKELPMNERPDHPHELMPTLHNSPGLIDDYVVLNWLIPDGSTQKTTLVWDEQLCAHVVWERIQKIINSPHQFPMI